MSLKTISRAVYDVCYDTDIHISDYAPDEAAFWADANAQRHARTIQTILHYAETNGLQQLSILNASGMAGGHQDFSIVHYLRNHTSLDISWTAFESPNSPFLQKDRFKEYVDELGIKVELSDFAQTDKLYGEEDSVYDVILSTEIAEHLDHSVLLRSLKAIKDKLKSGGLFIFTTPNLLNLPNRFRMLFGNGDTQYWGDQLPDLERGLYGHIAVYDVKRLRRILQNMGYTVHDANTFTWIVQRAGKSFVKRLVGSVVAKISSLGKNWGSTIVIHATKPETDNVQQP